MRWRAQVNSRGDCGRQAMSDTISITRQDNGIAILRLTRPDKHNALSGEMIDALQGAAAALGQDGAVRAVVLAGDGPSFCAGGDLGWMKAQLASGGEQAEREARRLASMLGALNALPKPLIGAVEGNAFGGGVGLMCVCDSVFASQDARFGLTETRLGLIPATIGPYVIARLGQGPARRVFMSARIFEATEAQSLGLVANCLPVAEVFPAALHEAQGYLGCAPGAVADAKRLAQALAGVVTQEAIDLSIAALVRRWGTAEAREGLAAFFDKRPPNWTKPDS